MGSHGGSLRLRVVTLNTWGLWLVSRRCEERMAALADWLRSPDCPADVVALQEVWVLADVERLRQAGAEGGALPHSFHYQSGALGSGLLLLSRFPISEVAFHPYSARGDPAAVLQGDYYVGKGVGWAALQTPAGTLSVFLTHLSANYGQEWQVGAFRLAPDCRLPRDNLAGVRLLQLAAFVRARGAGSPVGVVLAGDLNCAPDTLEFAMLKVLLPELRDAWAEAQPLRLGATANALESSFTTAGAGHRPIRIDYVLATGQPLHADLVLTDTGRGFSYSDHLGVAATLEMTGSSSSSDGGVDGSKGNSGSRGKSSGTADGGKQQGQQQGGPLAPLSATLQRMRAFPEPFHEAAAQIEEAAAVMARGRRHAVRFAAGLFAAGFGCLGALAARAWEQPAGQGWQAGDNYLLLLGGMGAALGWAGVVLVGGFVARGGELRALQQAAVQLRLAVGTAACKPFS